jgi:hypothetical protein
LKISSGSNDEGFGVSKVTHRSDRVHEQTVDPGHLEIAATRKPMADSLEPAIAAASSVACIWGRPTTP